MDNAIILPGQWLGVFGGGQLGRMFTHAAQRLGYHVAVWEPESNCPAGQAADLHLRPEVAEDEFRFAVELGQRCKTVTLEFENINSQLLRAAQPYTLLNPGPEFLEVCQNRLREKGELSAAGFPTTPFHPILHEADVAKAVETLGLPLVLKTASSGYDGKGQVVVREREKAVEAFRSLATEQAIAEKWISFEAEVSMIVARNRRGQFAAYPLFENTHANHILDITRCPVSPELLVLQNQAEEICRGIAEKFNVAGLFCVEFFATSRGLLINEIAPRPHNSGHLTIEAFDCSQFEQQVRAICNLPLAEPRQLKPAAMANLLGDVWQLGQPQWESVLEVPHSHLHLYGKSEPRVGRKMGHLTQLDSSAESAVERVRHLRDQLAHRSELAKG